MSLSTASFWARRAAQKQRVRILYRRALRDTLNWAVHRHLFYQDADELRKKFEANKNLEDLDTIDRMIDAGESEYNKWRHPDPYIVPWAPGGSKFCRNPEPPKGQYVWPLALNKFSFMLEESEPKAADAPCVIEIVYNFGEEQAELK